MLTEVCHDKCVERDLQPLTREQPVNTAKNAQDGARLDRAASGVWEGHYEKSNFDVCIFNPHTSTNRHDQLFQCYREHEHVKKREYEQRMEEVEHASFTSLVLLATAEMANEATYFFKRLASLLVRN